LVQVNLELKSVQNIDRINIIDVLKPQQDEDINLNEQEIMEGIKDPEEIEVPVPDPVLEEVSNVALQAVTYQVDESKNSEVPATPGTIVQHSVANSLPTAPIKTSNPNRISCKMPTPQNENITRWVMDGNFRKEQERLKIPLGNFIYIFYFMRDVSMSLIFVLHIDPVLWSKAHIQHWIRWAINQFNLKGVNPTQWAFVDGPSLCNMTHTEFIQRIPKNPSSKDPNHDLFWTHLELLRKCKFVGIESKFEFLR
jgi:GA-binding protein transcription factor alpha